MDAGLSVRLGASCSSTPPANGSGSSSAAPARSKRMAPHVSHVGVHDHGFNNVSTYGNLRRLTLEGRLRRRAVGSRFLRAGAESQRRRFRRAGGRRIPGGGFIYSFNGAHSLFVDTVRSLRVAGPRAHARSPAAPTSRTRRSACSNGWSSTRARRPTSASTTARDRDHYDVRGRVVHECMFNAANGSVPRSQHAAGLLAVQHVDARSGLGDARIRRGARIPRDGVRRGAGAVRRTRRRSNAGCSMPRRATCDFYIEHAAAQDGVPYWDTGAPGLAALGDWASRAVRSVQRSRTGRQLRRRDRGTGPAPARPSAQWRAAPTARATRRPGSRCSATLIDPAGPYLSQDPIIRACCSMRSTIGRTAGTRCRPGAGSRAANRASGATITCARRRCT